MVTNLPRRFGKYELLELLSVGGMAEVYLARYTGERGFQKILAIKKILPSLTEDPEFVRMFIDEGKIAGQLSHSNICQIYELGKFGESHFIAMEYVWGKDLLQIQNRFKKLGTVMPFGQACFIVSKLCEGLDYAHKKRDAHGRPMNIIHRDVSPQNILVSYEGEIKLIDFGIAKARDRSAKTAAGVLKGKFGYMSPEQVRGLRLDRRSDIFSLGIILWELVTGRTLFDGETDFIVLEKVRNVQVIPPSRVNPAVPPELEAVVMRALQRDPEDRYQWASDMHQALQAFMMTQRPVYTSRMLAQWMQRTFAREILQERKRLQAYFAAPAGSPRPAQGPPGKSMEEEEDLEGATVLDPDGSIGPLEPVLEEEEQPTVLEEPAPPLPAMAEAEDAPTDFDEEEPTLVAPGSASPEPDRSDVQDQATIMLDDEDPQAQALAERMRALASAAESAAPPPPAPGPGGAYSPPAPALAEAPPGVPETPPFPPPLDAAQVQSRATRPTAAGERAGASPLVVLLVSLGVALLGFAAGALFMKHRLGSRRRAIRPASALVVFSSTPDAQILLDGEPQRPGPSGAVVLQNLPPGEHVVSVQAPGHEEVRRKVRVEAGQVLAVRLEPKVAVKPGKLLVKLQPAEVEGYVVVNGTPHEMEYLLGPLPADEGKKVELAIYALGYQPFSKTYRNVANGVKTVEVRLEPAEGPHVQIVTDPPGADVFVGDDPQCKTPCRISGLTKGKVVELVVAKEGYEMVRKKVKIGRRPRQLALVLDRERAAAEPATEPARATEEPREPAPRPRRTRPRRRSRGQPRKTRPSAARRAARQAAARPKPPRAARPGASCSKYCPTKTKGCLWVNSNPRARIFIDGRNTGRNTPVFGARGFKLRPGRHRVTLVAPGGKKRSFSVTIKRCQVTKLIRSLR